MKNLYLILALLLSTTLSKAQTTAMDFTKTDCSGISHHLFADLDSGNVVVMEFIMTCNSCIAAGHALETMISNLEAEHPGKVRWYQIAYTNTYTCATMTGFKNTNGFSSNVFDQGASLVAYYGGFGMPTIAVAAGSGHDVLFTDVGFSISDTTAIGIAARNFFATSSVPATPASLNAIEVFPNPASNLLNIKLDVKANTAVTFQIINIAGSMVMEVNETVATGNYTKQLDISSLPAGMYLVQATYNNKTISERFKVNR